MNFAQHVKCYSGLLDHVIIRRFLRRDPCGVLADKYHLVIVFQYFMRANFTEDDYSPRNFFLALSLSHDIFDELALPRKAIMKYCLAKENDVTIAAKKRYQWDKMRLFERMGYRGFMEKRICHNLFSLITHKSIMRGRKEVHVGTFPPNSKNYCKKCNLPCQKLSESEHTKENDVSYYPNITNGTLEKCPSETLSISESSNSEWDKILLGKKSSSRSSCSSTKDGTLSPVGKPFVDPFVSTPIEKPLLEPIKEPKRRRISSESSNELDPKWFRV